MKKIATMGVVSSQSNIYLFVFNLRDGKLVDLLGILTHVLIRLSSSFWYFTLNRDILIVVWTSRVLSFAFQPILLTVCNDDWWCWWILLFAATNCSTLAVDSKISILKQIMICELPRVPLPNITFPTTAFWAIGDFAQMVSPKKECLVVGHRQ